MILSAPQFILGQDKKVTPPPTRIEISDDTTMHTDKTQKAEPQKPEMELPEVLVLGTERNIEVPSEKQNMVPVAPSLVKPDAPSEFVTTWFRTQVQKPSVSRDVNYIGEYAWAGLLAGNGITAQMNGGYWRQLPNGTISGQIHGGHDAGDFRNNAESDGEIRAQSSFEFGEGLSAELTGTLRGVHTGLHQVLDSSAIRNSSLGNFRSRLQYQHPGQGKTELVLGVNGLSMQSDTADGQFDKTANRLIRITGRHSNTISGIPVSLTAGLQRENLSGPVNAEPLVSLMNQFGLETRLTFSNTWTSTFGLRYETFSNDSTGTLQRFSPWGKLNYIPTNFLGFSLNIVSGYQHLSFYDRFQNNAYIGHWILPRPDHLVFGSQFVVDLQLSETIAFRGEFRYANYDLFQYWARNTSGFFTLASTSDVEVIRMRMGAALQVTDWLVVSPSVETYTTNYGGASLQDIDYIPYKPQLVIPVAARIDMGDQLQVNIESRYAGIRQTNLGGGTELDPYWDINAEFQRILSDRYSIFLVAQNMLSSKYSHWQGYPVNGIRILVGAKATF